MWRRPSLLSKPPVPARPAAAPSRRRLEHYAKTLAAVGADDNTIHAHRVCSARPGDVEVPPREAPAVWIHGGVMLWSIVYSGGELLGGVIDLGTFVGPPTFDLFIGWKTLGRAGRRHLRNDLASDDATWLRVHGPDLSIAVIQRQCDWHCHPKVVAGARPVVADLFALGDLGS
jgi:aminoglycoside phosphotransferase (APT) family kinase protein